MTSFILFFLFIVGLLTALIWVTRQPRRKAVSGIKALSLGRMGQHHSLYLPAIRRALCKTDLEFICERGSARMARRARKERRRVALSYLAGIRCDFERLMHVARVVAVLSPEIVAAQEWERFVLGIKFSCAYQLARATMFVNILGLPQLSALSGMVSGFASQMDLAIRELGERAAQAAGLATSFDQRGAHMA